MVAKGNNTCFAGYQATFWLAFRPGVAPEIFQQGRGVGASHKGVEMAENAVFVHHLA